MKSKTDYDIIKRYFFGGRAQIPAGILGLTFAACVALWPQRGVILIGDLAPVLMLTADSLVLLMGRIRASKALDKAVIKRAEAILGNLQIPIGFLSVVAGLVHALAPGAILL